MKKIKDDIQTKEALYSKLNTIMKSGLADFIKTTNARRIAVQASVRFVIVSVLFILAISIFLFMAQVTFDTLVGKVIIMTALLWVSVLLISGRSWFVGSALLAREVNMALVPILANTFNRTLLYTYNENAADSVREMLEDSSLVLHPVTDLQVKNVYTVFSDVDMRVHEIMIESIADESAAKKTRNHATFIDVNLLAGPDESFILSTTGSSFGFSHDDFVGYLKKQEKYAQIELNNEKYTNVTHFSTDAEGQFSQNATGVVESIAKWNAEAKVSIRMVRKGTKLYILVPASKESITYTSTSTKQEAIERYAQVIAQPIWRALLLAEEMV